MNIGIVGHEAAKFTLETEREAKRLIRTILADQIFSRPTVVSGACHLGGIDIWAEEDADRLGLPKLIFPPKTLRWEDGYKPRNIQIAQTSDIVHCIVVAKLPATYRGKFRFEYCYHCDSREHVKSGGCWTAKYAMKLGKQARWHVIPAPVGIAA